jgi:hypothetical protein
MDVPFDRYKALEKDEPTLYEAVNHVADDVGIPRSDLAALVYANSENNPTAKNGARSGYMGLTPQDMQYYDPDGKVDPDDPVANLYVGAQKYKDMSKRFGQGTASSFAAYYAGADAVENMQRRHPDEHAIIQTPGTFDFVNKVLGRSDDQSASNVKKLGEKAASAIGQAAADTARPVTQAASDVAGVLADPRRLGENIRSGVQTVGGALATGTEGTGQAQEEEARAAQSTGGAIGSAASATGDYLGKVYRGATGQPEPPPPIPPAPPPIPAAPAAPLTPMATAAAGGGGAPVSRPTGQLAAGGALTPTAAPPEAPVGAPASPVAAPDTPTAAPPGAAGAPEAPSGGAGGSFDTSNVPFTNRAGQNIGTGPLPPAGGAAALSPAGPAAPTTGSAPPAAAANIPPPTAGATPGKIDRLGDRPSLITATDAIRAELNGGPNGLLKYMSAAGAPGASPGQNFDRLSSLFEQAMILKGDPVAALHAREYVFRIQHEGAVQNTQAAYAAYQAGDLSSAAQLLARAHAFVPDGSMVGFQVVGGQIWGQRFSQDSHTKIGQPFNVNDRAILAAGMQINDPAKFQEIANAERTTNENMVHHTMEEKHAAGTLEETVRKNTADIAHQKAADEEAARYHRDLVSSRGDIAEQNRQAALERVRLRLDQSNNTINKQLQTQARKDANDLYGEKAIEPPLDHLGQEMSAGQRDKAANLYYGLTTANPGLQMRMAAEITRHLVAPEPKPGEADTRRFRPYMTNVKDTAGQPVYGVQDRNGNTMAYLPASTMRAILPNPAAAPTPPATVRPAAQPGA